MDRQCIEGTVHTHPRGFGFFTAHDPKEMEQTVFIPASHMAGAVQGDTVIVEILDKPMRPERGPEGIVQKVIKRKRTHVTGVIISQESKHRFAALAPIVGNEAIEVVQKRAQRLRVGLRVVIEITDWDKLTGRVTEKLGDIGNASLDIPCALREFEIESEFPEEAIAEALAYDPEVKNIGDRRDFREDEIITIDPTTARDYDDALGVTIDEKGHYHLGVHIADVTFYVRPGTVLDTFAAKRCNSVYFPGGCVPMLPEALSNELCSLKEGVVRLTASVLMEFDTTGTLVNQEIVRGAIKSQKRFTYEEAKKVLDGKLTSPHKPLLERMVELCNLLKAKRRERGSVDLALPETVIQVDKRGKPTGFTVVEYDITHQLVEEFALKANEVVATHLAKELDHSIYRVHPMPSEEDQQEFFDMARQLGFHLPPSPSAEDIQKVFDAAQNTPHAHQLAVRYIRTMKLAMYSPDNVGHFGLGLEYYCHFTSPIRRYPDLFIHRLLFEQPEEKKTVDQVCIACSDAERNAARAESRVVLLKKLRYLKAQEEKQNKIDPDEAIVYTATITKILAFGFTFEVDELGFDGLIHVSRLDGYFIYDKERNLLQTENGSKRYAIGDSIELYVEEILLESAEVFWHLV